MSTSHAFAALRDASRHDQPRLRYTPEPSGPPVWSATAGWQDLTDRHPVDPLTALAPGWTAQWALTFAHGEQHNTSTVATVSEADLVAADPIRVNSWHKNKTSRAGLRFMQATGRLHAHESLFERKLLCALDFHGATNVVSQPFTLTWHDGVRERNHTPDFLVEIDGSLTVINTRPAVRVNERLLEDCAAVGEMCLSRGWDHALVVGYRLPEFTIIDTVSDHWDASDHLGYSEDILDLLADSGPTAFDTISAQFDALVVARAALQRLIWERRVSIDLTMPLSDATLVALPGEEVRP